MSNNGGTNNGVNNGANNGANNGVNNGANNSTNNGANNGTNVVFADCSAPEEIGGSIDEDTVLDGCFRVTDGMSVRAGAKLTIAPSSVLQFTQDTGLSITDGAKLAAEGTQEQPILFTAVEETPGLWRGLRFDGTNSTENVLAHVIVEYGGSGSDGANLYLDDDAGPVRLRVTNSTFRHGDGYGVYAEGNQNRHNIDAFSDNVVTGNARAAFMYADQTGDVDATNSFAGNERDFFETQGAVLGESAWPTLDVPYRVVDVIRVREEGHLSLDAGTTVVFEGDTELLVEAGGALTSQGAEGNEVLLTGAEQTRGFWRGVAFHSTNSVNNMLAHTIIEYAGGGGNEANLYFDDDGGPCRIQMTNTVLRESAKYGFSFEGNQNSHNIDAFESNTATANARAGKMHANDIGEIGENNSFAGNDEDRLDLEYSVTETQTWQAIDAQYEFVDSVNVSNADLTIEAGATLVFGANMRLAIGPDASLRADGTADAPITFTSVQQTPGAWNSVVFNSSNNSANLLRHTIFEYGGGASGDNGMLYLDDDGGPVQLTIENSTFRHSGTYGIYGEVNQNQHNLTCSGNTFESNAAGDMEPADLC